jgi:hypothetical protein
MTTRIRIINFGPLPVALNTAAAQVPYIGTAPPNTAGAAGYQPEIVNPGGISGDVYVWDEQTIQVKEVA